MINSPLINSEIKKCVLYTRTIVPDGQGGYRPTWTDSVEFDAWFVLDSSTAARVAEKEGVTSLYTIYVRKEMPLQPYDAFRRVSDGAIFRVTSDGADKRTPAISAINGKQYSAERWVLPT